MNPEIRWWPRSRRTSVLAPLALVVTFLACDGGPLAPTRDAEAPIQTDRLAYELERSGDRLETSIAYSFTNNGSTPVFIQNCNGATGIVLEKRIDGVWSTVWGNVIAACLSPAIALLPGESLSGELVVDACVGCEIPRFETPDIEGIYRMVFTAVFDSQTGEGFAAGDLVPADRRRSNRFALDD